LVVIAIIAILAAILFPVFARARENARRSSCQSNEKQIALGFKQYIQDNNERYAAASGWNTAILDYTKSEAILKCPSAAGAGSFDYSYNTNMGDKNENKVDNTASTILVAEATRSGGATSSTSASAGSRHFDGSNFAFVDGHVKWIKGAVSTTDATGTVPTFFVPSTTVVEVDPGPTNTTLGALAPGLAASEIGFMPSTNTSGNNRSFSAGPWSSAMTNCASTSSRCSVPVSLSGNPVTNFFTALNTDNTSSTIGIAISGEGVVTSSTNAIGTGVRYTISSVTLSTTPGKNFKITYTGADGTQVFYFTTAAGV